MKKRNYIIIFIIFIMSAVSILGEGKSLTYYFSTPEIDWALGIKMYSFKVEECELREDGKARRIFAIDKETGSIMSVFIEPAEKDGGSKECREHYWDKIKNNGIKKTDVKIVEKNDKSILEYFVNEQNKIKLNQKNINVYIVKDGYWIDIHISKSDYKETDDVFFNKIIEGISIQSEYKPDKFDYFEYGNRYYENQNYEKAIIYYEKLFEIEKKENSMKKEIRRILMDNLIASYGISGKIDEAESTIKYGLSIDSKYPMFYYNMACVYAEKNNMEKCMENLKIAFEYKENMNRGTELPNPQEDSSFEKFMGNNIFKDFITTLNN